MISFSLWRPAKLSFHFLLKVNQQTHTPVVGDDNEMFSTAGYDLLLSQAAAVRRREDEREPEITGDKSLKFCREC